MAGAAAGYLGGWVDLLVMRGVDFAVVKDGKFLPLRMAGEHARKGEHEK